MASQVAAKIPADPEPTMRTSVFGIALMLWMLTVDAVTTKWTRSGWSICIVSSNEAVFQISYV
jgi:hypothetical protein